ncbi:unnamed protein product, partial [Durusdinium trenchii]
MEAGTSLRYFSGEDCDHREYRRWKQWVVNKMRTMDKLDEAARGSFIWTLLSGKALEVVEHLKEEDYQVKGGDLVIFKLLDRRWPELDRTDEIGENIAEVFALRAKEGETLRQWCARARECFDKCARKTGVKSPEEARGWILLNQSGMAEADRAICLARAQGDLKFDTLSQAMRSCFPDYVMPKRRTLGAHVVEEAGSGPVEPEDSLQDIELFLAEHGYEESGEPHLTGEELDEEDAAEILATTWKERRSELNQVQKGRRFTVVDSPAEHFVCTAALCPELPNEVLLVSSPGFAILDSGCGKTIIGQDTLESFKKIWTRCGIPEPPLRKESNQFRFGNGELEVSSHMIDLPVFLAGRPGFVKAAIVKGSAPLLLSRPAMKTLGASMNFGEDKLTLFSDRVEIPLEVNAAGQYAVNVSAFPKHAAELFPQPVLKPVPEAVEPAAQPCHSVSVAFNHQHARKKDFWELKPRERLVIRHHLKPRERLFTPQGTQCPIDVEMLQSERITHFDTPPPLPWDHRDSWFEPDTAHAALGEQPWTGRTVFRLRSDAVMPSIAYAQDEIEQLHVTQWTAKQHRQLMAQVKVPDREDQVPQDRYNVIEVFSPPRFALEGATRGFRVLSADLSTGWDFRRKRDREDLLTLVRTNPPDLLVLCPPCTWAGGWWHLNRLHMDPNEVRLRETWTQLFVRFCCQLMEIQLASGGRCLFEHPQDSIAWKMPCMEKLQSRLHSVFVDMCCYGLRVPGGSLIRKATRLAVSHADMRCLGKKCPGPTHTDHQHHQSIAGSWPKIGSISKHAAKYTSTFVRAVLRVTKGLPKTVGLVVQSDCSTECLVAHTLEDLNQEDNEAKIKDSLRRLHNNLGHPTNQQLVRVLKHGGASAAALEAAHRFSCDLCLAQKTPKVALPAQVHRTVEFNAVVGIDIKYLPGWDTNQKIPTLNIVDQASSLQIMVPVFKRETSDIIKQAFMERWVSWAGMPQEIVCDPARANVADAFTAVLEQGGASFKLTAGDAHWQLGKTEVHGGWFSRALTKILSEHAPRNQTEWLDCVNAAHCKNQLIQVYGMTPAQFVFGKNPRVPENLLDEPLEIVPATSALYDEAVAKQVAIRQTARKAVLDLQDSKALRQALAARPRVHHTYSPGTHVAYWRSQKWIHGSLEKTGRWCGPALVLGYVGRNLVIIHKRQIFRCAPEQIRPSTQDELKLTETPHMDFLGIKHLIESHQLESRQYVDLTSESYPGVDPEIGEDSPPVMADRSSVAERNKPRVGPFPMNAPPDEESESPEPPPLIDKSPMEVDTHTRGGPSVVPSQEAAYGPVRPPRRRVGQKDGPMALYRPGRMAQEDFQEMMQEIVPELLQQVLQKEPSSSPDHTDPPPAGEGSSSSSSRGTKRSIEPTEADVEPVDKRLHGIEEDLLVESATFAMDEIGVCSVELLQSHSMGNLHDGLDHIAKQELVTLFQQGMPCEVLVAAYMQKKAAKEIPVTGNPPEIQKKVDEAKLLEWNTIEGKHAGRVVLGNEADDVRKYLSHRIMGSRYVMTLKVEDDAAPRFKARWCLQGHLDPDLTAKAELGDLQ